ncbi:hypothetical protein K458DRAFT_403971 [Lentithecium fluviatile CBS 122367]|uniref:Uncharacterized protein n=1 Tax=Lentithecium fluviatile CBS 122367 TaxID=1168545 RepID=A0A6G1J280_9PLEO|nr:hypothetical protein K458DRAFT_403971 [Lentithecium fluviatile CBS 122367]
MIPAVAILIAIAAVFIAGGLLFALVKHKAGCRVMQYGGSGRDDIEMQIVSPVWGPISQRKSEQRGERDFYMSGGLSGLPVPGTAVTRRGEDDARAADVGLQRVHDGEVESDRGSMRVNAPRSMTEEEHEERYKMTMAALARLQVPRSPTVANTPNATTSATARNDSDKSGDVNVHDRNFAIGDGSSSSSEKNAQEKKEQAKKKGKFNKTKEERERAMKERREKALSEASAKLEGTWDGYEQQEKEWAEKGFAAVTFSKD